MPCADQFGAFTEEDLNKVREAQKLAKQSREYMRSQELKVLVEYLANKYSPAAIQAAHHLLNYLPTTVENFKHAIAEWDASLSTAISLKGHIKQRFPDMTQKQMEQLLQEMRKRDS